MTNIRPTAHGESSPQVLQTHPKNTSPLLNSFTRGDEGMASTLTKAVTTKSILKPVTTLKGHVGWVPSISYFADGQQMISGSLDKTTRRWDLKAGEEIEEERGICEEEVEAVAVAVSRDGRWVVTGGGDRNGPQLRVCEIETGIVKTFEGHSDKITGIDISADSTLLASGSLDETARIWNLETGKLVAGPFKSMDWMGAVRFSTDSKKLAIMSDGGTCLEVWDVKKQRLDARIGEHHHISALTYVPIFWTNKNKSIIAAFSVTDYKSITIYEFDASTLKTVGTPFKGHTYVISGLSLSFDGTLLASSSRDNTIKLWAFESRQLLASFDVQSPNTLVLSPVDSSQLAYTTSTKDDYNIYICNTPPDVLAQARTSARTLDDLLNSDATRRPPAVRRRPPTHVIPMAQRPPPTIDPQQPIFHRLRKLLPFSSRTNAIPPVQNSFQPRCPLDFPATLPLPSNRLHAESPPSTPFKLPGGSAFFNRIQSSSDKGKQKARELKQIPAKVVEVPLGQATYGDAVGVDDGYRPFVLFFCLSWFQKKEKKQVPRPVYDDELEDDEEEEDILNRVAVSPPRVQHEEIELKIMASQSQPEAGPSRLAVIDEHEEGQFS